MEKKMDKKETYGIEKSQSIKSRLQRYFFAISFIIIFIFGAFSICYFYNTIKNNAKSLIQNKLHLAQILINKQKSDTETYTRNIVKDRAIILGLEIGSSSRLNQHIEEYYQENNSYDIVIFNAEGECLVNKTKLSLSEQSLVTRALNGENHSDYILSLYSNQESPAIVCAYPVEYNGDVIGVVLTRFIFETNSDFFINLSKDIESELSLYYSNRTIFSTNGSSIPSEIYGSVAFSKNTYQVIDFLKEGLNEYCAVYSDNGSVCFVLHTSISGYSYMLVFSTVLVIYLFLSLIISIIVVFAVLRVSSGILKPVDYLLENVNQVQNGNFANEIILDVQDEIGRLGSAFNELRLKLNDKIVTIEDMNSSLEKTIEERTEALDVLNKKMKHYLSPQLYASIAGGDRDVSVDKHYRKKLTVFFSDVVNFTATTESLEAEDLSTLLNSYLDSMAEIAQKYGGTIDKYVGDAVMVFFGDPEFTSDKDHAIRAVKMAMEMQERLIKFREEWRSRGVDNPFHVRMGINTGYCTIGNFGSETKMDYTIIGNNVNLAARFEAAAEPDSILMSPETYMLVSDEIKCVVGGEFTLKGVSGTIKAYTPVKIKKSKVNVNFAKVTSRGEILFPQDPVDLRLLSNSEKKQLLLSVKNAFHDIVTTSKEINEKKIAKQHQAVRQLDGDEGKAKKVPNQSQKK